MVLSVVLQVSIQVDCITFTKISMSVRIHDFDLQFGNSTRSRAYKV